MASEPDKKKATSKAPEQAKNDGVTLPIKRGPSVP